MCSCSATEKFRKLRETRGLYTTPTLLAGSLDTGSQFMIGGSMEPLAIKKNENFCQYLSLYPEYKCIFIGDNGQGDVRTAEMILDSHQHRDKIERVYIHEIQPLHLTHTKKEVTKSRSCPKICYFVTYIDAAIDAFHHKLIALSGLRRIVVESTVDFNILTTSQWSIGLSGSGGMRKRESRMRELNRSIHQANAVLLANGVTPVPPLKFQQKYAIGTAVMVTPRAIYPTNSGSRRKLKVKQPTTLVGYGVIERFRPADGMYEVLLLISGENHVGSNTNIHHTVGTRAFFQVTHLRHVPLPSGFGKTNSGVFLSIMLSSPLMPPIVAAGSKLKSHVEDYSKSRSIVPMTATDGAVNTDAMSVIGSIVWTPYGLGEVLAVEADKGVVVCSMKWGATSYLQISSVVLINVKLPKATSVPPEVVPAVAHSWFGRSSTPAPSGTDAVVPRSRAGSRASKYLVTPDAPLL